MNFCFQEVVAVIGHSAAAVGFAFGLAVQQSGVEGQINSARKHSDSPEEKALSILLDVTAASRYPSSRTIAAPPRRAMLWVRQEAAACEAGEPYGQGLAMLGVSPENVVIVRTRTFSDTLRAGLEAMRCANLRAVLIETMSPLDLTASRRLKLAAEKSGVQAVLLRHADVPASNAVSLRWRVAAALRRDVESGMSRSSPCVIFEVELTKNALGMEGQRWRLEWDHEHGCFKKVLPGSMVAFPVGRPLAA